MAVGHERRSRSKEEDEGGARHRRSSEPDNSCVSDDDDDKEPSLQRDPRELDRMDEPEPLGAGEHRDEGPCRELEHELARDE